MNEFIKCILNFVTILKKFLSNHQLFILTKCFFTFYEVQKKSMLFNDMKLGKYAS